MPKRSYKLDDVETGVPALFHRARPPVAPDRLLDARLAVSTAAGDRIVAALEAGIRDFIITSRDGSISANVRLSIAASSISSHAIGDTTARVDWSMKTVAVGDNRVTLSRTEMRVLAALIERHGACITRRDLIQRVWGADERPHADRENALGVYICSLRKRLTTLGLGGALKTIRGAGYQLVVAKAE